MPELQPQSDSDITARLVEQLTRTNERLERLEAALRERSLLPGLQHKSSPTMLDVSRNGTTDACGQQEAAPESEDERNRAGEAESHFRRGVDLCQAGTYGEAVVEWQKVLDLQPDNPYALANIGIVYTEEGRWTEARDLFKRVLDIKPDNAEAHYGLGMSDAQLGDYDGAITEWEKTLQLQPDNKDARYNLALVRQRIPRSTASEPLASAAVPNGAMSEYVEAAAAVDPPGEPPADDVSAPVDIATIEPAAAGSPGPEDRSGVSERDWKRVDDSIRRLRESSQPKRGVARVTRPPGPRSGRPSAAMVVLACIGSGAIIYAGYRLSPLNTVRGRDKPAVHIAPARHEPAAAESQPNPGVAVPEAQTAIVSLPQAAPQTDRRPMGPARWGRMQVRLGSGLSGRFRYWFVFGDNRAARMKSLPRASRYGIISVSIPAAFNHPGAQLRVINVSQGTVARLPVLDVSRPAVVTSPNVGPNLVQNSDFTQGGKGWIMETTAPGRGAMRISDAPALPPGVTGRSAHFDVQAIGKQNWNVQCYQSGVDLKDRQPYMLSFWAMSDRTRPLHLDVLRDRPNWQPVGLAVSVKLSPRWQKFILPFTTGGSQPSHTRISFILGEAVGPVELAGVAVRASQGGDRSTTLKPGAALNLTVGDFN